MASSEVLLGTVLDADTDPVEVLSDQDGTVTLRWDHGTDMVFGRTGRDKLRELLDRAAMPGQAPAGPAAKTAACRSCGAEIHWGRDAAGKRVPVDAAPREDGNLAVQLQAAGGELHVRTLRKDGVLTVHEWRAVSHFATCPDAQKWRERGSAAKP